MTLNQISMINACAENLGCVRAREVNFIRGLKKDLDRNPFRPLGGNRAQWLKDCHDRLVREGVTRAIDETAAA